MRKNGVDKRHFRIIMVALAVFGLATLLGYYFVYLPHLEASISTTQSSIILMDTIVDVRAEGRNSPDLVQQVFSIMETMEKNLSRFVETSEVTKINNHAGEWVEVHPSTLKLIELGIEMGDLSQGAFDITIGAALDLWGFGSEERRVPDADEIQQALLTVDYTKVEIDQAGRVRIPVNTILDLGGIAKGYIVDAGTELLRKAKVERAFINAGGDISVIGRRPDNQPWNIGVQDPDLPSDIRWVLPLDNQSVVTSGDYQRFFTQDGQRWHHIIDPNTGYPARGLRSVTVVGDDVAICDALSTAIFVLGMEQGKVLVEQLTEIEAILVSDTDVWISPGLSKSVITQ